MMFPGKCWFDEAKLGLFIHWGLYALLGHGEWVMKRDGIPAEEYAALVDRWEPIKNPAEEWCRAAAECGMKYAVFTTRHHDGFALFRSEFDTFNSLHSPAACDYVEDFVRACRKYGLKIGLYYSIVDWRFVNDPETMKNEVWIQLKELMSRYGKIDMLWYDGTWHPEGKTTAEFFESEKLNGMIHLLQPEIMINDRSGIKGDFSDIEGKNIIRRPEGADRWELCMTMGDDDFSYWGYCRHSVFRKTPEQDLMLLLHTLENGGNLLLNVSPDPDGKIPEWQTDALKSLGRWVNAHAEHIYSTEATDIASKKPGVFGWGGNSCGFFTRKDAVHYFFYLYAWPGAEFRIPYFRAKVKKITFLGKALKFQQAENGALIVSGLPENPPNDDWCNVLTFITEK